MTNGIPEWIPPAWLDPHRRPRHNTTQHLPDITFDVRPVGAPSAGRGVIDP
jgi:hypothetical protein